MNLNRCYTRVQASTHQDSPLHPEPSRSCASIRDPSPKAVQTFGTLLAGGNREKPLTADLSCFTLVPLPLSLITALSLLGQ